MAFVLLTSVVLVSCAFKGDVENGGEGHAKGASPGAMEPAAAEKQEKWEPPPPASDDHDWIRMKSGEWLKGEIDGMREGELEFDSDEFDEQEVDWKDIVEMRSPRKNNTLLLSGNEVVQGTILLRDNTVFIETVDGEQLQIEKDRVRTILPADTTGWGFWKGKFSLGFTVRSGNTNQVDLTTHFFLRRRTPNTRFTIQYNGSFQEVEEVETVNTQRAATNFDYFLTHRFYLTPALASVYRDPFQNVDYRVTPGAGVGYRIFDEGDLQWDMTVGGAYRYTQYVSVEPGEDNVDQTGAVILGTRFEKDLTSDIDLTLDYALQVGVADVEDTNMHARLALEIELTRLLDLDVALVWDRIGDPQRDSGGDIPEQDDFYLTVGLGVDF